MSYDVYKSNFNMFFLNKVEVIRQFGQSVMNIKRVDFLALYYKNSEIQDIDNGYSI